MEIEKQKLTNLQAQQPKHVIQTDGTEMAR